MRLWLVPAGAARAVQLRPEQRRRRRRREREHVRLDVPVRGRPQPRLRAHGARVGERGSAVRRRTTLLVGGATAVALALGGLVGGVLAESRYVPQPAAARVALGDRALTGAAAGIGASTLTSLETRVRSTPRDATSLTELGFAYQLRWRETADASNLPRSEAALRRAVRYGTDDANA